jgi:hypothetical protein
VGNRSFPFNAGIRLELVAKEFDFVAHGFVDVVLIRCMMGQFCRTFHCEGCMPGEVLARSNEGIG